MSVDSEYSTVVIVVDIMTPERIRVGSTEVIMMVDTKSISEDFSYDGQLLFFPEGVVVRLLKDGMLVAPPSMIRGSFNPNVQYDMDTRPYVMGNPPPAGGSAQGLRVVE